MKLNQNSYIVTTMNTYSWLYSQLYHVTWHLLHYTLSIQLTYVGQAYANTDINKSQQAVYG